MEFDPVSSAQYIPDMIKNDTLIEVLDEDQLSECLKHIILTVDESLYILDQVQSRYNVPDRFKAVRHISTDFGENDNFDFQKFVAFVRALGKCFHFDIIDSIANIFESSFTKNFQANLGNQNIEELKNIAKTEENFDKIYKICERIATENDRDAMSFAVREKYVYMTGNGKYDDNILTKAADKNNKDLIRLLIESGIDINSKDKNNFTALICASGYGYHETVKLLLSAPGIDVNAATKSNSTALICASEQGHQEVVKQLLSVPEINVNARDTYNNTALILASKYGNYEVVKLLLAFPGIDINAKNKHHKTALTLALQKGHHEIVNLLKSHANE